MFFQSLRYSKQLICDGVRGALKASCARELERLRERVVSDECITAGIEFFQQQQEKKKAKL